MAARRYRSRRSIAVLVAAVAIVVHVAAAVQVARQTGVSSLRTWNFISYAALWVPFAAMAALIAIRGARRPGIAMLALSFGLISLNKGLASSQDVVGHPWPIVTADIVSALFAAGAYLRTSQLFPRPLRPTDLELPSAPWARLPPLRRVLAVLLRPWAAWAVALGWLLGTLVTPPSVWAATGLIIMLIGTANYYIRFRVGTEIDRRRVMWLLQLALTFAVLRIVQIALQAFLGMADAGENARAAISIGYNVLSAIAGVGCLGMAVFGAGAFNPSLVVRSTVVYGAAISLLLFALNVITSFLVDSAVDAFGLDDRIVAATLGALAGLLVEPIARALRRLLERLPR